MRSSRLSCPAVTDLTSSVGIVALAAAAVAFIALIALLLVLRRLRRLQADQRVVLGEDRADLVQHAAGIQQQFSALHDYVIEVITRVEGRMDAVEGRMDAAVAYHAVVRYDAYNEMSGRQSTSIALLDAGRTGVVLTSIHHRDQARIYVKQVRAGVGSIALSPEEQEAVRAAMAGEVPDAVPPA